VAVSEVSQCGIFYPKICDITDEQAVQDVFHWVNTELGSVSILVNNAGIIIRTSLLGESVYENIFIMQYYIAVNNGISQGARAGFMRATKNCILDREPQQTVADFEHFSGGGS